MAIDLRGELGSMLELCAEPQTHKSPEAFASGLLQIKMVAGTRNQLDLRQAGDQLLTMRFAAETPSYNALFRAAA